jgi:outer membrane protein OmpA-like peptidoglycan-associated protein
MVPLVRGRAGYTIAVAAVAGGLAVAALIAQQLRGVADELQQIVVPGDHEIVLTHPGAHTIFHEQRAVFDGRYFAGDRQLEGLELRLTSRPGGEEIEISPASVRTRYAVDAREGSSIATFRILHPGTYRLRAWYPEAASGTSAVLAIGQGVERRVAWAIGGSLAAGFIGLVAGVVIAAGTFRRRRHVRAGATVEEGNVKTVSTGIVLGLLLSGQALAQAPPVTGKTPPRQPLASVEARWEHVYCDLTELARTSTGELNVRYQYRNAKKTAQALPHLNLVQFTMALDATNNTLFGVLEDSSGRPISSTMLDVTAARPIPAGGAQAHWARLQGPPEGVTAVTVLVDGCLPFEDVKIGGAPSVAPLSAPARAIASQESETPDVVVELTGVNRTPGGFVTITFRYRNNGSSAFRFPHQRMVRGAYFLDGANRKKYDVVQDQRQQPLCSESLQLRGQTGDTIGAGSAMNLWAKFPAPPESTKTISVSLPLAPPFDDVAVSGAGAGSTSAGSAVAGSVVGLDAALKDLGAKVSETEIRIELAADVLFDFDKADIKTEAEPSLQKVATVLEANPGAKVSIEGHTDGKGQDPYNQKLSEARAASVKQWLVTHAQVSAASVTTRGWGKTKPVAHNTKPDGSDDPEGRAKNRRVEIVVRKGA